MNKYEQMCTNVKPILAAAHAIISLPICAQGCNRGMPSLTTVRDSYRVNLLACRWASTHVLQKRMRVDIFLFKFHESTLTQPCPSRMHNTRKCPYTHTHSLTQKYQPAQVLPFTVLGPIWFGRCMQLGRAGGDSS